MATTQATAADTRVRDHMPLNGIDHLELWVGNAAQAAYFLTRAYGFSEVAYAGLETGARDRTSHVLESGRIAEEGTHEELLGRGGTYSNLAASPLDLQDTQGADAPDGQAILNKEIKMNHERTG